MMVNILPLVKCAVHWWLSMFSWLHNYHHVRLQKFPSSGSGTHVGSHDPLLPCGSPVETTKHQWRACNVAVRLCLQPWV